MKANKGRLGQWICGILVLVLAFMGGMSGSRALRALPDWQAEDWQKTYAFEHVLYKYIDKVMAVVNTAARLEEEELDYVERRQLENSVTQQWQELQADRTAFRFQLRSETGNKLWDGNTSSDLSAQVQTVHYSAFRPVWRVPGEGVSYATEETYGSMEDAFENAMQPSEPDGQLLVIECGVASQPETQEKDEFYQLFQIFLTNRNHFSLWLEQTAICLILAGIALLVLLILAARSALQPDYALTFSDRIWLEPVLLLTVGVGAAAVCAIFILTERIFSRGWIGSLTELFALAVGALSALCALCAVALLRTLTVRLCSRTLLKHTMLGALGRSASCAAGRLAAVVPVLWRAVGVFLIYCALNLALYRMTGSTLTILAGIAVNVLALVLICRWVLSLRVLKEGSSTIASGNLNHQVDTARMPHDLKELGENLNNISQGMSEAVNEKMKSERFKAELITNVSHDLKTPLTSIINYVDLLKTTDQTDPRALTYIGVLDRKSMRLKKLTEDLVEASKASTGVLNVNREKIGMAQLIDQALGEWEEKLTDHHLTVVTNLPEGETWVYADGRHLWRVIDNLLSNCCKYAMEGTRVYLDLQRNKGQVELSVKNVSREALNMPPEQLMERFVRGETSRSTEGSGLGLSIARSLTELQGGTFRLAVDGDLFKAIISLPQAG